MADKKGADDKDKKEEPKEKMKEKWFWPAVREALQNVFLGILFYMGFRRSPQAAGGDQPPATPRERQTPGWVLSMFPKLTREDNDEYGLILGSVGKQEREAAKGFRKKLEEDPDYDDIRYVVDIVRSRREFMERVHHPACENKGSDRLVYSKITLDDPVTIFFGELLEEERGNGAPEEIYARQLDRAKEWDFLPKIHWARKYRGLVIMGTIVFIIIIIHRFFN